jgi:hypothetical protein
VEGKKAFEAYSHRHGVKIEIFHAHNGIFKAYKWTDACKQDGQGMTFAAVNAHHQNGIAVRRIRELQDLARALLAHANARWSDSITANLWPYAIRNAGDAINHTPSMQEADRRSPIEIFSNSKVATNPKHWKPFGCPTYVHVLTSELQSNRPFHKWSQRSKAGIYLGRSPQHGRNVALVMDRDTALVSPQFHVAYDDNFDNVRNIKTKSTWLGGIRHNSEGASEKGCDDTAKAIGEHDSVRQEAKARPHIRQVWKGRQSGTFKTEGASCSKCRGRGSTDTHQRDNNG